MKCSVVLGLTLGLLFCGPSLTSADDNYKYTRTGYYPSDGLSRLEIYEQYMALGKFFLEQSDYEGALQSFQYAQKFNPSAEKPAGYINLIKRKIENRVQTIPARETKSPASRPKPISPRPSVGPPRVEKTAKRKAKLSVPPTVKAATPSPVTPAIQKDLQARIPVPEPGPAPPAAET